MGRATGWLLLAVTVVISATTGLCLHDLSSDQWLTIVGPTGILGAAGIHLSAGA